MVRGVVCVVWCGVRVCVCAVGGVAWRSVVDVVELEEEEGMLRPASAPGVEVVALEQHVCRLDVAVHQLHAVQVLDGQGHLKQRQVQRLAGGG